jgi:NADPH:quinone reductase
VAGTAPTWELRELPVPDPGAPDLLVRVHAAGLNRADLMVLDGSYRPGATGDGWTAGFELAGEVVAVGEAVSGVDVGDRVMGSGSGAFADFALLDHRAALPVPEGLDWTQAAALPIGLMTEHDALVTQAGMRPDQTVLVIGASSGVGTMGVQLARHLGASRVLATTTSAAKVTPLAELGADRVIDLKAEELAPAVLDATEGAGVDIVLDHVGGDALAQVLAATAIQGVIINIGRLGGAATTIDANTLAFRRIRLQGTTFTVRTREEVAEVCARVRTDVLPAVASGAVRPLVDRAFAFDAAADAADQMRSKATFGKLVLQVTAATPSPSRR